VVRGAVDTISMENHMLFKRMAMGLVALACAVPAVAQNPMQRGTMEFGAFASAAQFDKELTLNKAVGGGGRIGMFLDPRVAIEFEEGEMLASRPDGLKNVNVGIFAGRLVVSDRKRGPFTIIVGAGAGVSTETNFLHSYGWDFLAGVKMRVSDNASFRLDGLIDFLANNDYKKYQTVRAGISWYRHPHPVKK
jgi:hypothetical protein